MRPHPWDSPGKNTGVGCHFLLQCIKVKSESEVIQSCLTLRDPMDCSLPGSSVHGIFQARVLEWVAIVFSAKGVWLLIKLSGAEPPCPVLRLRIELVMDQRKGAVLHPVTDPGGQRHLPAPAGVPGPPLSRWHRSTYRTWNACLIGHKCPGVCE